MDVATRLMYDFVFKIGITTQAMYLKNYQDHFHATMSEIITF